MSRTWKEVKADKTAADREAGRDVEAARTAAREATQAYVLGFRLAQLSPFRPPSGVPPTSAPDRRSTPDP